MVEEVGWGWGAEEMHLPEYNAMIMQYSCTDLSGGELFWTGSSLV